MLNKGIAVAGLVGCCASFSPNAPAQEKIFITPAAFGPNVQIVDSVKRECELEEKVDEWVYESVSKKYPGTARAKKAGDAGTGKVLKLTITNVVGVGGGAYSGAKSMTLQAELIQGGKVVASTTKNRASGGGAFGGMKGTCAIFGRVAKALGADVAAWLPSATK